MSLRGVVRSGGYPILLGLLVPAFCFQNSGNKSVWKRKSSRTVCPALFTLCGALNFSKCEDFYEQIPPSSMHDTLLPLEGAPHTSACSKDVLKDQEQRAI